MPCKLKTRGMEIKITTKHILGLLYVLSWIIFVGVCIEAGSFIFNAVYTALINPEASTYFGLKDLYTFDHGYFLVETLLMSIVGIMRALIFYLIVQLLHDKKLDMSQPFNKDIQRFISRLSYLALGIGFFSWMGVKYTAWFASQGVQMPDIQLLRLGGADVWLFMGVILLVLKQIFKRGVEIQTENELTV